VEINHCQLTDVDQLNAGLHDATRDALADPDTRPAGQDAQAFALVIVAVGVATKDANNEWHITFTLSVTGMPTDAQIATFCDLLRSTVARSFYPSNVEARERLLKQMVTLTCTVTRDVVKRSAQQATSLSGVVGIPAPAQIDALATASPASPAVMLCAGIVALVAAILSLF
jgi:hypothetical protein